MGNSPSTGHGSEETHVATMEVRKTGERPTEDQSRNCIETKSDSNEDPNQKPPQNETFLCCKMLPNKLALQILICSMQCSNLKLKIW